MFKLFKVENYRCFDLLELASPARINLITGQNNVGKTALLESIWINHGFHNASLGINVDAFRGLIVHTQRDLLLRLFKDFDYNKKIILTSINEKNEKLELTIEKRQALQTSVTIDPSRHKKFPKKSLTYPHESENISESSLMSKSEIAFIARRKGKNYVSRVFIDQDKLEVEQSLELNKPNSIFLTAGNLENIKIIAERLSNLIVKKSEKDVIDMLRIIEQKISSISIRAMGDFTLIYCDVGLSEMVPIALMGEGMTRLLRIGLAISDCPEGIVLIDEIENGLHYKAMKNVWSGIAKISSKYSCQIFATTHSRECIIAAHEAFANDNENQFQLHRLDRKKNGIVDVVYDKETLQAAIDAGFEVR